MPGFPALTDECRLFFRLCRFGGIVNRRTDDSCDSMDYAASAGECTVAPAGEDKKARASATLAAKNSMR
jgi:hypothetical protein